MSQVRAIQLRRGTRAELDNYGPLLIGELGFCTDTKELFIGTPSGNILVNPETIDWSKVTGKPGTFTPSSHSHAWGDITGKPSTFTPSSHTHPWSQVTGAPATATRWPSWSEVTDKPSTFTPSSHTHSKSDVGLGNVQNYGIATQAQAQAGTANDVYMTPLRVKEAISSLASVKIAEGSYIGNSPEDTNGEITINVGFTPKLVVVIEARSSFNSNVSNHHVTALTGGVGQSDRRGGIQIITNGFIARANQGGPWNKSGRTYRYFAIG